MATHKLSTCKNILTKIDYFGSLTYATPWNMEDSIKYIRVTIVEPNPVYQ